MKRLLLWIVILATLFSGGAIAVTTLGTTAPPSTFAAWFAYLDGKPCSVACLFGIQPGTTTMAEVERLLRTQSIFYDLDIEEGAPFYMYARVNQQSGFSTEITIEGDEKTLIVRSIKLWQYFDYSFLKSPYLSLKDMISIYGIPPKISLSGSSSIDSDGSSLYKYLILPVAFETRDNLKSPNLPCRLSPTLPVGSIFIFAKDTFEEQLNKEYDYRVRTFYPWAGVSRHTYGKRYFQYEPDTRPDETYECIE